MFELLSRGFVIIGYRISGKFKRAARSSAGRLEAARERCESSHGTPRWRCIPITISSRNYEEEGNIVLSEKTPLVL